MTKTVGLCESYDKYKRALNDIDDDEWLMELTDGIFLNSFMHSSTTICLCAVSKILEGTLLTSNMV